jgi:hypothetical protein
MDRAYPNRWFIHEMKLQIRSNEKHEHWFAIRKWVQLA